MDAAIASDATLSFLVDHDYTAFVSLLILIQRRSTDQQCCTGEASSTAEDEPRGQEGEGSRAYSAARDAKRSFVCAERAELEDNKRSKVTPRGSGHVGRQK